MNPIAIVHWTDAQGCENRHPCFDTVSLNGFMSKLRQKDYMFIVYMTNINARVPMRPPRRHIRGA